MGNKVNQYKIVAIMNTLYAQNFECVLRFYRHYFRIS